MLIDEGTTSCCYGHSEKHWVTDPQGIAWEHFHTLASIPVFSERETNHEGSSASACCAPTSGKPIGIAVAAAKPPSSCC